MHLTSHTDYALRVLMHLGLFPGVPVPVSEIAAAYGISENHLATVAKHLVREGLVTGRRGRGGGLVLAVDPATVHIGQLVARLEPDMALVECLGSGGGCALTGACTLTHALDAARRAFVETLDRWTLADLLHDPARMRALLGRRASPPDDPGA
jgi:Rrf2 family nitric oxide-sensitive transcriptional repressor